MLGRCVHPSATTAIRCRRCRLLREAQDNKAELDANREQYRRDVQQQVRFALCCASRSTLTCVCVCAILQAEGSMAATAVAAGAGV